MNFSLNIGEWNSVFAVPSSVVDQFIKLAGGSSLKLLLYLLRHGGESFSDEQLKSALGFTETGELEDAALFWIQRGVIRYTNEDSGSLVPAGAKTELPAPRTDAETAQINTQLTLDDTTETSPKPATSINIRPVSVSSGEIASRMRQDDEIAFLFKEAERVYARPLNQRENQTVIGLVDHFGLPAGVALMLLKYCFNAEKKSPSYINTVAQNWSELGINTIELADAKIRSLEKQNGIESRLREALELKTALTPKMREMLHVWSEDWGFSEEMILLACNKTIDQIGKLNPAYTNKILENWKKDSITTPEAANSEKPSSERTDSSIDMDDVMSKIKKRYKK